MRGLKDAAGEIVSEKLVRRVESVVPTASPAELRDAVLEADVGSLAVARCSAQETLDSAANAISMPPHDGLVVDVEDAPGPGVDMPRSF